MTEGFKTMELIERLKFFMENEARSCSMNFGCVTPEYVFRMWGGAVAIDEIATAMEDGGEWDNTRPEVRGLRSDHYIVKRYE